MLPTNNDRAGLIQSSPGRLNPGYTLVTTAWGDHATLIDMEGRACHRWRSDEGINYAYMLDNGNLLCRSGPAGDIPLLSGLGGNSAAIFELDWDGNQVWSYRNPMLHHDFQRMPNGNTLVLLWEEMPPDLTARVRGGREADDDPDTMLGDVVREITPDGSVVYQWRAWEHLDVEEDVICPLEHRREWTHANSLGLADNQDFLISFRQTNVVGIVDRASGEFRWKWGPGSVFHQHDATYLANGHVMLFDNGMHRGDVDYSRVIEIDPDTNEIVWEYTGNPPESFYSPIVGNSEWLPNGNILICEGAAGRIFELTPMREVVWEYVNPFLYPSPQTGTDSGTVFKAHRYGLDHPALKGKKLEPEEPESGSVHIAR